MLKHQIMRGILLMMTCAVIGIWVTAQETADIITAPQQAVALPLDAPEQAVAPFTYAIDSPPEHGTLSGDAPALVYTPDAGYTGIDRIVYTVVDANGVIFTASRTIRIEQAGTLPPPALPTRTAPAEVTPVPSPAIATSYTTAPATPVEITLREGSSYTITAAPQRGTLSGQVPVITYTPDAGFSGQDSFTYTVDADGQTISQMITITVQAAEAQQAQPGSREINPPAAPPRDRTQTIPGLDVALSELVQPGSTGRSDAAVRAERYSANQRVEVVIEVGDANSARQQVQAAGGNIRSSAGRYIVADVPVAALQGLANAPAIRFLRTPEEAITPPDDSQAISTNASSATTSSPTSADQPISTSTGTGSIVSEGIAFMNADTWQAAGHTGQNIKIGLLDDGFDGLDLQGEGACVAELLNADGSAYSTVGRKHGRAVAETICDVAPNAQIYARQTETDTAFVSAMDDLVNNVGVDILTTSLAWVYVPGDGSSLTAAKIDEVTSANDVMVVTTAGNNHMGHWEGNYDEYTDSNGTKWHGFNQNDWAVTLDERGGQTGYVAEGRRIAFSLVWDEWGGTVTQDFDLFLYHWTGSEWIVAASSKLDNLQNGQPYEGFSHMTTSSGLYRISIAPYQADPTRATWLQLSEINSQLDTVYHYDFSSVTAPGTASSAFAVGAVYHSNNSLETYSGRGPANKAGGEAPIDGQSSGNFQPQLVGPTGTKQSAFSNGFYGTSAAAPHVAGAAALVWGANRDWTADNVADYLRNTASAQSDPGDTGADAAYGFGIVYLDEPPSLCANATIGVFRRNTTTWYLRDNNSAGDATLSFNYGTNTARPLAGDWDNDCFDSVGFFSNGTFWLRNSNSSGDADIYFDFASADDIAIVGDWNGDGTDTIGAYRPGTGEWFLRNSNAPGDADITFRYGAVNQGYLPIAGDWDGDGTDTIGIYHPDSGTWFLKNANAAGEADLTFIYGIPHPYAPVIGDWDGDGADSIGIYDPDTATWFLANTNAAGAADMTFIYGELNESVVSGIWDPQ